MAARQNNTVEYTHTQMQLLVISVNIAISYDGRDSDQCWRAQIFDAIIIGSSFAIDIVFLGGVAGEEGQKAAAVLVVLLLWRIARVVDGKLSTSLSLVRIVYYVLGRSTC